MIIHKVVELLIWKGKGHFLSNKRIQVMDRDLHCYRRSFGGYEWKRDEVDRTDRTIHDQQKDKFRIWKRTDRYLFSTFILYINKDRSRRCDNIVACP